jgi:hypothetical protein
MMFHKNNPFVNGLTLDTAWSAPLAHVSSVLIVIIINEQDHFAFDFMTGFAAGWSPLEFVFILMELVRNLTATPKDLLSFELYGEGAMLTVASVICALQQE